MITELNLKKRKKKNAWLQLANFCVTFQTFSKFFVSTYKVAEGEVGQGFKLFTVLDLGDYRV